MKTSKLLGLSSLVIRGRKSRIILAGVKLAVMIYAFYKVKHNPESPKIE